MRFLIVFCACDEDSKVYSKASEIACIWKMFPIFSALLPFPSDQMTKHSIELPRK